MGYTRLTPSNFTTTLYNALLDSLETIANLQGGRGVLSGLALSAGSGLTLNYAAGTILAEKATDLVAGSASLPASSTVYVWIDEGGAITTTGSFADPGGTNVCLGKVTTDATTITAVTTEGRMALLRWTSITTLKVGDSLFTIDLLTLRMLLNGAFGLKDLAAPPAPQASHILLYQRGSHLYSQLPDGTEVQIVDGTNKEIPNAKAVLGFSAAGFSVPGGSTAYAGVGSGHQTVTEANAEFRVPVAGKIRKLYAYVSTNTITGGGTGTVRIRKNGTDPAGQPIVTYAAAETGAKSDLTNSFSVAAGDRLTIQVANGGAGFEQFIVEAVSFELG